MSSEIAHLKERVNDLEAKVKTLVYSVQALTLAVSGDKWSIQEVQDVVRQAKFFVFNKETK